MKIFDITLPITNQIVQYLDDSKISIEQVFVVEKDKFSIHQLTINTHTGTHIDFPSHLIGEGRTSSDYEIGQFIGNGVALQLPSEEKTISKRFLQEHSSLIEQEDIIIFKTSNSELYNEPKLIKEYVYMEPEAAEWLIDKKAPKIIGIDYLSVDKYGDLSLPVHRLLLAKDILILEGICLAHVPEGRYKIFIMPLNIPNMDGLPVRAFLEEIIK